MIDLSLVETKDLLAELAQRTNTGILLAITVDEEDVLSYHRKIWGKNCWSLATPLKAELCALENNFLDAPGENDPVINF